MGEGVRALGRVKAGDNRVNCTGSANKEYSEEASRRAPNT